MFKGKRILAFVLMVVMLLSLLPVFALAEEVSIEGRTNLITNGGFEESVANNPTMNSGSGSLSTEYYHGGEQSLKVTYKKNVGPYYTIDVTPGHTYYFKMYYRKGTSDSEPGFRILVTGGSGSGYDKALPAIEEGVWGEFTHSWTAANTDTNTATKITVYFKERSTATGACCYFDDFEVYDLNEEVAAEKFELKGATVDLGNSLDMNFYIDPANLDANKTYTAKIVRSYADGTADEELTVPVDQTKVDTNNSNYIYVTYGNIAAKEMGDKIAVTIYDSEGNAVSETWTDSVKDYAERALVAYQDDAETVAVLQDLLNYGAAAQAQFEYDVANPVDSDLTDIRSITVTGEATANEAKKGTTLTLKSNILMEMFFFKDKVGDATTATVTYTNHRGTEVTEEVPLVADDYYLDAYKVQIEGLVIADINTKVTVTVGDITVTDTMAWFVKRSSTADIYSAILALGDSAYAYFH